MHQPERKALAEQLLGTAKKPGPLDAGWVKRTFGISGTALMNWRKRGIPRDRVDDVLEAVAALGHNERTPSSTSENGAMSAFLERWESRDPPLWAQELAGQILTAVNEVHSEAEAIRAIREDLGAAARAAAREPLTPPPDGGAPNTADSPGATPEASEKQSQQGGR